MIKKATFGAGCFWCIEACFKDIIGVLTVEPGYAGGFTENPTYEQICNGNTGHAEVAHILYDENVLPFSKLLELFWFLHDPTQLNKQGNDIGSQYRSVIFYHDEIQKNEALDAKKILAENKVWDRPIVTAIEPFSTYYTAEKYHLDYFEKNPDNLYCQAVVRPKVEKFKLVFEKLINKKGT